MRAALVALLLGCGGVAAPGDAGPSAGGGATAGGLELGQGYQFEPVADRAAVPIVTGPQGSPMLVLAVRVREPIAPGTPRLDLELYTQTRVQVTSLSQELTLAPAGEGLREAAGLFAAIPDHTPPSLYEGQLLEVRLRLTDGAGRQRQATRVVRAVRR